MHIVYSILMVMIALVVTRAYQPEYIMKIPSNYDSIHIKPNGDKCYYYDRYNSLGFKKGVMLCQMKHR